MIVGGASVVAAPLLLAPLKYHSATGFFIVAIAILLILVLSIFPYGLSHRKRWAFGSASFFALARFSDSSLTSLAGPSRF
jgi:hypothetical protein